MFHLFTYCFAIFPLTHTLFLSCTNITHLAFIGSLSTPEEDIYKRKKKKEASSPNLGFALPINPKTMTIVTHFPSQNHIKSAYLPKFASYINPKASICQAISLIFLFFNAKWR